MHPLGVFGLCILLVAITYVRYYGQDPCTSHYHASVFHHNITVKCCGDIIELWTYHQKWTEIRQSRVDASAPLMIMDDYAKLMGIATLAHPHPRSFINIGLGAGVLPRFFLNMFNDSSCVTAELDSAMISVYRTYFEVYDEAISTRHFIKLGPGSDIGWMAIWWGDVGNTDVIWMDACRTDGPDLVPPSLKQPEFLRLVKAILSPKGMLISNSFESSKEDWVELLKTYRTHFNSTLLVCDFFLNPTMIITHFLCSTKKALIQWHW